jgi:YD repeat-containing protein
MRTFTKLFTYLYSFKTSINNKQRAHRYSAALLMSILVIAPFVSNAQDFSSYTQNFNAPSANAFAFSKVGNIPLNHFTGQVDLTLPLYQKELSSLLPVTVSMRYTGGGGIKYGAPETIVGKGWMLNVGGVITRNERGVPDDFYNSREYAGSVPTKYNGILYNGGVTFSNDGVQQFALSDNAFHYSNGMADAQHDIFEFNFFGRSGKFYIGKNNAVQIVTDSKIKIIPTFDNTIPEFKLSSFLIIDETGIEYFFTEYELSKEGDLSVYPEENIKYYGKEFPSSWLITKVRDPFKADSVMFEYQLGGGRGGQILGGMYSKRSDFAHGSSVSSGTIPSVKKELSLKTISFTDGSKIEFEYYSRNSGSNDISLLLKRMKVVNPDQQIVTDLRFGYQLGHSPPAYSESVNPQIESNILMMGTRYLRDITMITPALQKQTLYAFDYFLSETFNEDALAGTWGIDFWGYYNGKVNQSLTQYPTQWQTYLPDRNPDGAYAKLGSLKKIIYPTGGWEEFEYELNDKRLSNANVPIGGIRIKKRSLFDATDYSKTIVKEYKYVEADGVSSSGFLGEKPEFTFVYNVYEQAGWPTTQTLKYTVTNTFDSPVNPLSSVEGNFVGYRRVEELYQGASTNIGKVVYEYTDLTGVSNWYPNDYFPYRPVDRPYWAVGLPKKVTYFTSTGNKVKETINEYAISSSILSGDNFRSMHLVKQAEADLYQPPPGVLRFLYKVSNYYPVVGLAQLTATHEYEYSSSTPQTSKYSLIQKTYDPTYYVERTSTGRAANGETRVVRSYYPFDFNVAPNPNQHFTKKLANKNILNIPLLKETWQMSGTAGYLLYSEATEFKELPGGMMRPGVIHTSNLGTPLYSATPSAFDGSVFLPSGRNYQPKLILKTYDAQGRLVEYEKEGGVKSAIILDSSGETVAKGDNLDLSNFSYSGFEYSTTIGGWTYSQAGVSSQAKLGAKSFAGTISRSSLPLDNYSVTFWAKGTGNITVNGTNQAIDATWKKYRVLLSNITSVTINTNGNLIDELLLNSQRGIATTYNYKKGVGVSSSSDPNGEVTYYEYDDFNRLKALSDNGGNLVKAYEYAFKVPFQSVAKSGMFIRDNCMLPTYTPGPAVNYVVPAGKYTSILSQAEADAKAASDVAKNGQNYANQNGICNQTYYNVAVSAPFTKVGCPAGTFTHPVYYVVPAGTYSSIISQADADAKAQTDISTNGQAYANTNGVCRQLVTVNLYNGTGVMLKVSFSGMGTQYDFPTGSSTLSIPQNTYTVYIVDPNGGSHTYYIGSRSSIVGVSATYNNVNIAPVGGENSVNATN